MNKVKRCIIFFLRNIKDIERTDAAPDVYIDIELDEILFPALKELSIPTGIRTVSFIKGKFSTLISNGSGGKIMTLPLSALTKKSIALPKDSKNHKTFEFLTTLAGQQTEIPAIIYLPD